MVEVQRGLKRRTIKQVIQKKLEEWFRSLPKEVEEKVRNHIIITGGCIASMLLGEGIKDFDLYCDNKETAQVLAEYYVSLFNKNKDPIIMPFVKDLGDRVSIYVKSAGVIGEESDDYNYYETEADGEGAQEYIDKVISGEEVKGAKYRPVFLSENAITLSDKIQIVIRFTGPPDEIHKNYDFVHATNYYYTKTGELTLRAEALESLLSRALIYRGSLYPVCSLFRIRKFMERGWRITAGEIVKIAFQISELDLKDQKVLRNQLVGVDAAYFYELLRMIEEWRANNEGKPLDSSYIVQLIDEMADQI